MPTSSRPRKKLVELIREQKEREAVSFDVEMTLTALEFLKDYEGDHPLLRHLSRTARKNPRWVPTPRQVTVIHRLAHRSNVEVNHRIDSLGNRLRQQEREDLPDSLDEPDWL